MTPGVIGLGSMGFGAAASLVRAGFATHGYDVVPAARERFADAGGILVDSPADLAAACDLVAVFVVNADQIEQVVFGSGLADTAAPGTVFILSATIPPTRAEDFGRRLAAAGMLPIDAPVSGGAAKAAAGAMTIMASGPDAAFDRAGPVLDAIATRVFRLGEAPGEGSRMKLVNQHLAGIHIAAAAEALVLAIGMGLDPHQVLDTIRDCAGTSWMFENRGPHIADGDYTPLSAVDIFVKDLGIVVEEAARVGLDPAVAARALEQFRAAAAAGWGRDDDSAVAKVYARAAGIALPEKAGT
jgi:3-hydroxyisobutyrate dehydrogenase-like beta-hydroxyacid dehydrogenase